MNIGIDNNEVAMLRISANLNSIIESMCSLLEEGAKIVVFENFDGQTHILRVFDNCNDFRAWLIPA